MHLLEFERASTTASLAARACRLRKRVSGSPVLRTSLLWLASEGAEARTLFPAHRCSQQPVFTSRVCSGPYAGVLRFSSFCTHPSCLPSRHLKLPLLRAPLSPDYESSCQAHLAMFAVTYAWSCLLRVRALGPSRHSESICLCVCKSGSNHLTQARPRLLVRYVEHLANVIHPITNSCAHTWWPRLSIHPDVLYGRCAFTPPSASTPCVSELLAQAQPKYPL